ncbi:MAG: C1 family peptidase [Cyanobacteria bacterium REEB65]|nr:C1 family peptidase [Cyanobacteria bacterium REEB65]
MSKRLLPPLILATLLAGCGLGNPTDLQANSISNLNGQGGVTEHGFGFDLNGPQHPYAANFALYRGESLPTSADLRQYCSPIADQGQLGACTAFAMGKGLREWLENKDGVSFTPMSALYLYYKERQMNGTVGKDAGSTITTGMTVLQNIGDAPEVDDPYNILNYNDTPSAQADTDAGQYKIQQAIKLNNLQDIKASIAEGYPAVFGFVVYKSFESIGPDGMMPMPKLFEPILGGHAVMAVGYDDTKQVVTMRNSWGANWGDHGYFYMPYSYFGWGRVSDIWSAR